MAVTGLALAAYAALRTETEEIWQRAALGMAGLVLIAVGIAFV